MMSPALICFVEDSDLDFELGTMGVQLAKPDAEIVRAKCCTEGRRILKETVPQLILLDLNLSNCKGFELLKEIAESFPERLRQVVVFTTSSNPTDREMALRLGASDFQTKSPDPERYLLTIRQIVSKLLS